MLLPILAKAAIGEFDTSVSPLKRGSRELNEILMGVQVLLDTIRQQQLVIEASEAKLHQIQNQTTEILARVLDSSVRSGRDSLRLRTPEDHQLS